MDIQYITELLLQYKYLIMFLLMWIEGPVVGFISAFLAAKGIFNFGIVYILSIMGDSIGDLMRYWIGRFGRCYGLKKITHLEEKRNFLSRKLVIRFAPLNKRFSGQMTKLEEKPILGYLQRNINKRFFLSLLIVKITPPLSVPGQFSFGFFKVSFRRYFAQTVLVCFLFESIFLNLGYFSSISANTFQSKFDNVSLIISSVCIAAIALFIAFFIMRRFRSMSKRLHVPVTPKQSVTPKNN